MKCKEIQDNLSAYLDQALSTSTINLVEDHLKRCSSCQQELIALREIRNMIKALPVLPLPDNFQADLHQRLMVIKREEDKKGNSFKKFKSYYPWISLGAAAVLILALSPILAPFIADSGQKSDMIPLSQAAYNNEMAAPTPQDNEQIEKSLPAEIMTGQAEKEVEKELKELQITQDKQVKHNTASKSESQGDATFDKFTNRIVNSSMTNGDQKTYVSDQENNDHKAAVDGGPGNSPKSALKSSGISEFRDGEELSTVFEAGPLRDKNQLKEENNQNNEQIVYFNVHRDKIKGLLEKISGNLEKITQSEECITLTVIPEKRSMVILDIKNNISSEDQGQWDSGLTNNSDDNYILIKLITKSVSE